MYWVGKLPGIESNCIEASKMVEVEKYVFVEIEKFEPKNHRKKMSSKVQKKAKIFVVVSRNQSIPIGRIGWNAFYQNQLFSIAIFLNYEI